MKNLIEKYTGHLLTLQGFIVVVVLSVGAITLSSNGQNILSLLASAGSSLSPTPVIFYFTPYESKTLQIGDTTQINVNVKATVPINAVGVTIKFPQDLIEIEGVSKEKSFLDLWTEDTSIHEGGGTIHFSGGTTMPGGLTGTSTALTITIKAKEAGEAILSFEDAQVFASDGTGTALSYKTRSITYEIPEPSPSIVNIPTPTTGGSIAVASPSLLTTPTPPSPDLNGDGKINLVDVSIIIMHIFGLYNPRFDLNSDGSVGVSDLSTLLSKIGGGK